ncbi:MAG: hypothetical protein NTZ78_10950 [Candidatus Aureabacteria bacterium]|nr:hypothetical protein [Candidatus Auribacterota bacterium]
MKWIFLWFVLLYLPLMLLGCSIPQSGRQVYPKPQRSQYELENEMDQDEMQYLDRNEEYGDIVQ